MHSISLDNLTVSYSRHPALHHISGEFKPGSLTAIAGPNGAGKSTLLKTLAGILKPSSGKIIMPEIKQNEIAYLPQAAEIQKDFPISIMQMLVTGFWRQTGGYNRIEGICKTKALEALESVGLKGFENRQLSTLSAGQFQRALFARLLLQDAKIILLDEPFNAVDSATCSKLLQIIHKWHEEKRTVICVLHDLTQIRDNFPTCLLLARKCIGWEDSKTLLVPEKLFNAQLFHEAWKDNAELCEQ